MPLEAAGIGASIIGGILQNRKSKTTQENRPYYTPEQQSINSAVAQTLEARMRDPAAGTAPIKLSAKQGINRTYAGAPSAIKKKLGRSGFSSTGASSADLTRLETQRYGDLGGLEAKMAEYILRREDDTLGLAQRFGQASGSTTTGTQPGNMLAGGFNAGASTLTTLLALDKLSNGQGGGGGRQSDYNNSWIGGG
jgi:hypothetical protein